MSETKMYSVLDKWTDLEKENIVDFTSVDGVVTQARLNGVPVGGGGGATANLTVTINTGASCGFWLAQIHDGIIFAEKFEGIDDFSPVTIAVPLGPSGTLLSPDYGNVTDTSGSIEFDSDNSGYLITGDCSITFSTGGGDD